MKDLICILDENIGNNLHSLYMADKLKLDYNNITFLYNADDIDINVFFKYFVPKSTSMKYFNLIDNTRIYNKIINKDTGEFYIEEGKDNLNFIYPLMYNGKEYDCIKGDNFPISPVDLIDFLKKNYILNINRKCISEFYNQNTIYDFDKKRGFFINLYSQRYISFDYVKEFIRNLEYILIENTDIHNIVYCDNINLYNNDISYMFNNTDVLEWGYTSKDINLTLEAYYIKYKDISFSEFIENQISVCFFLSKCKEIITSSSVSGDVLIPWIKIINDDKTSRG